MFRSTGMRNLFLVPFVICSGGFEYLVQSIHGREVGERVSLHLDPENIQIMSKPQSEDEEVARDV